MIAIGSVVASWSNSIFAALPDPAWDIVAQAEQHLREAIPMLPADYAARPELGDSIVAHRTAVVEPGAVLKGPVILGANTFVAAGAYLRAGVFLDQDCIVGPGCELKSTFMLGASRLAHLSFVGDSVLGSRVNVEAGAVIANYRNELADKRIRILWQGQRIDTAVDKFGALVGDDVRIGANAVIAPGAIIAAGQCVPRLGQIDQYPQPA